MKAIIFAGGHGTRLWPLSRKNSPKQFEQIFEGKSTYQLAIERIEPLLGAKNIYVGTNQAYKGILKKQSPQIPTSNYFLEPEKRDLAAAICLDFLKLEKQGYTGSIAILWADHMMERVEVFRNALKTGDELITANPDRFVFIGEKPRFANHNLGWISIGEKVQTQNHHSVYAFESWKYRPELDLCIKLFESGKSLWNPGYFVTSVSFVVSLFKKYKPDIYALAEKILANPEKITEIYPKMESISFDDAILEKVNKSQAVVLSVDMGWSDPGTLYALKEALEKNTSKNVTRGLTRLLDTKDSLVFNQEKEKLVTTIGLDGFVVINTDDTLLVVHKDRVPDVKKLVGELEKEKLEKFI